jgi:Protein of unknown function (DUF4089)
VRLANPAEKVFDAAMKRRTPSKRKPVRATRGVKARVKSGPKTRAKAGAKTRAKPPRGRRQSIKTPPDDFSDALMDGAARALGLTIDPSWRESVKFNLRLVLHHAARVEAFSLPDDVEPAPVFHA